MEHATAAGAVSAPSGSQKRPAVEEGEEPSGKKTRAALEKIVVDALTATSLELSKHRKKRVISPTVATPEEIAGYASLGSFPVHATRKGGILSLDICPDAEQPLVASAGADSTVHVYNHKENQSVAVLKGHSKKVLDVSFVKDASTILSAGMDGTVRLWKASGDDYECAAVMDDSGSSSKKGAEVVSVNVHPSGNYFLSACSDGAWSMYDLAQAERLVRVGPAEGETPAIYSAAALHPDGLILCTGTDDAKMKIWETRTQQAVASFDGHVGRVASLSFSENGYYMASAASDGVKIWDLRKLKNIKSFTPFGEGVAATSVSFDKSGLFLGVGGPSVAVYAVKQDWSVVKEFSEFPKKGVHTVAWGHDARSVIVGAADHNLRFFGAASS